MQLCSEQNCSGRITDAASRTMVRNFTKELVSRVVASRTDPEEDLRSVSWC